MQELGLPILNAFLVGLLGGVHCVGMCGGIVGSLTFGLPEDRRGRVGAMMPFQLAYNLGRIASYVIAGAIMGGIGMLLAQLMPVQIAQRLLLALAGIFMILLGFYLSGWWMILTRVERLGNRLWQRIEPLGRTLLPVRSPAQALVIGALWGWLPCGLVYSMLITSVSSGSALNGALLMFAFALGTLPNLLIMGMLAGAAARLARSPLARGIAGVSVILFGVYSLWQAI